MKKTRDYWFGIAISFLLAGLLAFLGVAAVTSKGLGWGAAALVAYAVMYGGPLAILLAVTWIVYLVRDRRNVPGHVHALMFVPTLLAALIVPVSESIRKSQWDSFRESHPAIAETHVNLSGRTIWLDTREASAASGASPYMEPASAGNRNFSRFRRYPGPDALAKGVFPYDGARLKEAAARYVYLDQAGAPGASLPLRRLPYPDLGKLPSAYAYGEAGLLVYQYFHYADRVEVAPGIARFSLMTEQAMESARIPGLAIFGMANYTPETIARVEINGQAYDMGGAAAGSLLGHPCHLTHGGSPVLLDLEQPVRIRWQALEDPGAWREAAVAVPAFGKAGKADSGAGLVRVRLYFLPDGTVAAERYQEIRSRRDELAIRATGLPPSARPHVSCGAYAGYNPQTVRLLGD